MSSLVSIIVPIYKVEKYLEETLGSVLKQTYTNWELILIDDGSPDGSVEIAKKFLDDRRIKLISQANQGVSVARNNGINASKGTYIAFLDADDIWEADKLEKQIGVLESSPEIGWVFSDMQAFDDESGELTELAVGNDENILDHLLAWDREVVPGKASNLLIRKSCFDSGISYDPELSTAADQDFCIHLAAKYQGRRVPGALWKYRVLADSMSRNIQVMEDDHLRVFRKAQGLFRSRSFRNQCFANLYLILGGSWYKQGDNKMRGIYYLLKAFWTYPPIMGKLMGKL